MEMKKLTPIHIGLFGHIDSGKTAIAEVLSEIISTAGIDAHPQSKERGITIDLGFTSFILEDYIITLVDGPGHADLIKISASSVEIIDCAIMVIDINKGPQVQTGEHLIMIEALGIKNIIVVLNKTDLFKGSHKKSVKNTRDFFESTSFGGNIPVFAVSAKDKSGFDELKSGILNTIRKIEISRDLEDPVIFPIDHHFTIKGLGPILTGTLLKGTLKINDKLVVLPVNTSGRVKSIQIFHENVNTAKAGDRVGLNIKDLEIKKIYRGCYATNQPEAFDYGEILEVWVNNNQLFKPETHFGTQVHVTIGMHTVIGSLYPFYLLDDKKIQTIATQRDKGFNAILWLHEKVLLRKKANLMLISRLDLPPTTLRILGSAELRMVHKDPPTFYKYKVKKGKIQKPEHSQGVVCIGLAESAAGAKKIVGRKLEPPFTKILGTFGTKGAVIVGIESKDIEIQKGDPVQLKELRSFQLKKI